MTRGVGSKPYTLHPYFWMIDKSKDISSPIPNEYTTLVFVNELGKIFHPKPTEPCLSTLVLWVILYLGGF